MDDPLREKSLNTRLPYGNPAPVGLLNGPFLLLNCSYFFVFSNVSLFYLYPLALKAMGSGPEAIGWVMGLFSVATVASRPFMGKLVGAKGEYPVMRAGIGIVFLAALAYLQLGAIGPSMFFVRLVHGLGYSAYISGSFSLVARALPPERQGEAYGVVGAAIMAATAIAPSAGDVLLRHGGFHVLYLTASGCALVALAATLFPGLGTRDASPLRSGRKVRYLPLLKDPSFMFLMASTLIFAHCQSTIVNFLALMAAQRGGLAGRFFLISFGTAILVLLTMGRVMDRLGKRFFLRASYLPFALGLFLIPALIASGFYLIPAVLSGAAMGLLFPAHNALAAGYGKMEQKPAAMSFFTSVYDSGFITGAVFSGWVAQVWSLEGVFLLTGGLALGGLLLVLLSPIREH